MADLKATLAARKEEVSPKDPIYSGDFRILNKYAVAIEKVGVIYKPKNAEEIAELEYQVAQGRVLKS